ncbi:MAG: cytochrome c [Myxococcota bacterium]|nr:cytochrome c [Myxococcota bacterium]
MVALAYFSILLAGCDEGGNEGASLWFQHCGSCHGALGQGTDLAPNVAETSGSLSQAEVVEVILNGFGLMDPVSLELEQAEAVARFLVEEL